MPKIEKHVIQRLAVGGFQSALHPAPTLSELFHENTKFTPSSARESGRLIAAVARSPLLRALMARPYKVFSLMDQVALGEARPSGELEEVITARRSTRTYSGESLSTHQLAHLLHFSYGETDRRRHYRAVGSGGALYPLELYAFVSRVDGLDSGIYHYNVEHHCLDVISRDEFGPALQSAAWLADVEADRMSVLFVVTAVFRRSTMKYKDRGYRMVLMEAGAVAQNMCLVATRLGLAACVLGGFQDDALSALLEIDGYEEAPLLLVAVGRPRS